MEVFISYSHKDVLWKDRVAIFMQCMKQESLIDYATWDDGDISPSQNWKERIQEAIKSAKVAILLVSPDFLCSPFIRIDEVPWLLERQKKGVLSIVPVIVRPCPWEIVGWLAKIQLHPNNGIALSSCEEHQIEEHLKHLALEVGRLVADVSSEPDSLTDETETLTEAEVKPQVDYRFLNEIEIKDFIGNWRGEAVLETMQLFKTKKQHTWLATTNNKLYCILDSQTAQDGNRLIQWDMPLVPGIRVKVKDRSRIKFAGLLDIGKRQNWYYNLKLHPDPKKLEQDILDMIERARHS